MMNSRVKRDKRQAGFTLIELLVTMGIFVIAIAAFVGVFIPLLNQFKQQSRVAETQIEGIVGLETLRKDIESGGYGLPWNIPAGVTYQEAANAPANNYNDSTANPPRGIISGNNVNFTDIVTGSDYLVIKATSVSADTAASKWTDVSTLSNGNRVVRAWQTPTRSPIEDLNDNDKVIVLIPSRGESNQRILVNNGSSFTAQFNLASFDTNYSPGTPGEVYLIYGVSDSVNPLRMPFNRVDYYISTLGRPARCAPKTGVLTKAFLTQENGTFTRADGTSTVQPLFDCVADMQVVYGRDTDNDGLINDYTGDLAGLGLTAQQIRNQVKEIRVYILAHEGQKDNTYTYPNATIELPGPSDPGYGSGSTFDFAAKGITDWQRYRWKIYTIVARPKNLR